MIRLKSAALCALALAIAVPATPAFAQAPGRGQQADPAAEDALRNAGPCPYVKVLYDAGRYVEFKDGREAASSVAFTGEIQGVASACTYQSTDPIKVSVEMLFALGKGSQAASNSKTYRYWVAVTQRNTRVLTKEYFDLPVNFPAGQDRVMVTEQIQEITIPRAAITTSGSNFEVLIGFDVTPQMAAFNRDGKRFRVNVQTSAAAAGAPATP
jgi:hypothetical protein